MPGKSAGDTDGIDNKHTDKNPEDGSSGNRTRVLGFEAQEDILYPMDPLIGWCCRIINHSAPAVDFTRSALILNRTINGFMRFPARTHMQ